MLINILVILVLAGAFAISLTCNIYEDRKQRTDHYVEQDADTWDGE